MPGVHFSFNKHLLQCWGSQQKEVNETWYLEFIKTGSWQADPHQYTIAAQCVSALDPLGKTWIPGACGSRWVEMRERLGSFRQKVTLQQVRDKTGFSAQGTTGAQKKRVGGVNHVCLWHMLERSCLSMPLSTLQAYHV
jgi:hypothetical protein